MYVFVCYGEVMEAAVAEREAGMTEWNDGRLDELSKRVDDGFTEMREGFQSVNQRIDTMQRTLMQIGGAVLVAMIGLIATQV
jgi:hypothetical protein